METYLKNNSDHYGNNTFHLFKNIVAWRTFHGTFNKQYFAYYFHLPNIWLPSCLTFPWGITYVLTKLHGWKSSQYSQHISVFHPANLLLKREVPTYTFLFFQSLFLPRADFLMYNTTKWRISNEENRQHTRISSELGRRKGVKTEYLFCSKSHAQLASRWLSSTWNSPFGRDLIPILIISVGWPVSALTIPTRHQICLCYLF